VRPSARYPRWLLLGCACPRGQLVARRPTATYRFRLQAGRAFTYAVKWQFHKPHIITRQHGRYSYLTVRGPRKCAAVMWIKRVTIFPS
jgi:hypothetical protein